MSRSLSANLKNSRTFKGQCLTNREGNVGEAKRRKAFGQREGQIIRMQVKGLTVEDFDKRFETPLIFYTDAPTGYTISMTLDGDDLYYSGKRLTWRSCLKALRTLPSKICCENSFVPSTPGEEFVLAWFNADYSAISQWLEYLVLGERGVEDFFTEKLALKPRADLSKAVFNVAAEMLPRNPDLQQYFTTPLEVWWQWEHGLCRHALWGNGLLTGVPDPQIRESKRARSDWVRSAAVELDWLDNCPGEPKIVKSEIKSFSSIHAAWDELIFSMSLEDKTFRRGKAVAAYKRAMRGWARECRSPRVYVPRLENGVLKCNGIVTKK